MSAVGTDNPGIVLSHLAKKSNERPATLLAGDLNLAVFRVCFHNHAPEF